ncbi:HSP-interacting protein [Sesamum indicum]|uniref:HSP-interacting protein n=1 Tax=Sesamum indicum TaxID=4182 RepID=A0A6I9TRL3_SESIN|nr:HSP-interacting protein [Sesamum indicum]XP_011086215.1 HSP-interacting protein [Sesamum indicum]
MGKSGGRKKKTGANQNQSQNQVSSGDNHSPPVVNGGVNLDSSVFLKRAHELKEEGNRRFQAKDYVGALQQYENALKLTPKMHPDRAVFHSNRAACLMQMKPIDYETVISECNLALQVQPQFVRALLRRARAFEAVGKYELAMQDVQSLLISDPNHGDALEIAGRLRMALGPRQEAQQDLQSRPSPAALGASAVRGAPIAGLGPCLPARPVPKKQTSSVIGPTVPSNKSEKLYPIPPIENGPESKNQLPKVVLKPSNGSSRPNAHSSKDNHKEQSTSPSVLLPHHGKSAQATIRYRPLKLVYDHDIRLAEMPVNCTLKVLRDVISKRFPMSKAVLIKYKDSDGDLVTITCTAELRLAESSVDNLIPKDPDTDKGDFISILRLHIVEVSPEQEPPLLEEEEEKPLESDTAKGDENVSQSSVADSAVEAVDSEIDNTEKTVPNEKTGAPEDPECKEVEMDDWLFEFAQLFRTHVGIDPDAHIDLHELGMELCSEALEETVTSEEAQNLFDKAALKFQEVAALAFFNWGNVHMCAARKKIPIDESAGKEMMDAQLQNAYDWVREKYSLAREKYEEALLIKPDFYEGLLALGQQQFEMAKLHWSFVLAKKEDLSKWDPTETIGLFDSAEEKMKSATEMWEKMEEQRVNELKDPSVSKKDELLKRRKKQGGGAQGDSSGTTSGEISPEEAAEQAAVMRSQIHLFWGNMLFERSQIECKLGLPDWKKNLDVAVERFKLAGASEADISTVLKNHCSNEEAAAGHEKKVEDPISNVVDKGDN